MTQVRISEENSLGKLLKDFGLKTLCDGTHCFPVTSLDSRIVERQASVKQGLDFPIFVYKQKDQVHGRSFMVNPGFFSSAKNAYYFIKRASLNPGSQTFTILTSRIRGNANLEKPIRAAEEPKLSVRELRSLIVPIPGGGFPKFYRVITSDQKARTICQ